jgi:hypothetical protein
MEGSLMGAILTIDVEAADVEQFFVDLADRATNGIPGFLGYVGQDMVAKFRGNIDQESGGPDFPGWAALSKMRVKQRELHGLGGAHPMLKGETGDLYSHLTFAVSGSESVSAGMDGEVPYAATNDLGEGLPQRSFVWVDDPRIDGWVGTLGDLVVDGTPLPAVSV